MEITEKISTTPMQSQVVKLTWKHVHSCCSDYLTRVTHKVPDPSPSSCSQSFRPIIIITNSSSKAAMTSHCFPSAAPSTGKDKQTRYSQTLAMTHKMTYCSMQIWSTLRWVCLCADHNHKRKQGYSVFPFSQLLFTYKVEKSTIAVTVCGYVYSWHIYEEKQPFVASKH